MKKERELFRLRVWEEGTGATEAAAQRLKTLAGIERGSWKLEQKDRERSRGTEWRTG